MSVRGKDAVVVVSVEEYERLKPPGRDSLPLVEFLQGLHLHGLDTSRTKDGGRDVEL